jgi:hypothetical protein
MHQQLSRDWQLAAQIVTLREPRARMSVDHGSSGARPSVRKSQPMSDSRITAATGAFSAITAEPSVTFGGKGLEASSDRIVSMRRGREPLPDLAPWVPITTAGDRPGMLRTGQGTLPADSVLENRQVQASRTAPRSASSGHSPSQLTGVRWRGRLSDRTSPQPYAVKWPGVLLTSMWKWTRVPLAESTRSLTG